VTTIVIISIIGFFCLVAELLNFRKYLPYVVSLALVSAVGSEFIYQDNNQVIWGIPTGETFFNRMIAIDMPGTILSVLLIIIAASFTYLGARFYKHTLSKMSDFMAVMVFALVGALLMAQYNNFSVLFLGIETLSISLYILAASDNKNSFSIESGLKYFLMGSFATGFLLLGIALVYGVTGSFDIQHIRDYLMSSETNAILWVGVFMILVSMLFKAAIVPFHFWAPDVYTGSPMLVTGYMATLGKVAIIAALIRFFSFGFFPLFEQIVPILIIFVVLTLIISNITAIRQDRFRRIMAYSGISNAGFMILGIIASRPGFSLANSVIYYAIAYVFSNIVLFCSALLVQDWKEGDNIVHFNGFAKKYPIAAFCMSLALLSLAGIPPLGGFWGKYFILLQTIEQGYLYLAVLGILVSVVSLFYYFKIIYAMYVDEERIAIPVVSNRYFYVWLMLLFSVLLLVIGLMPDIITSHIGQ
jgi:NADH-quinone oxidoreductase subunit N